MPIFPTICVITQLNTLLFRRPSWFALERHKKKKLKLWLGEEHTGRSLIALHVIHPFFLAVVRHMGDDVNRRYVPRDDADAFLPLPHSLAHLAPFFQRKERHDHHR